MKLKNEKKIGILGIGNLLLEDEGFGVHVINFIQKNYSLPENVSILDGGTAGIYMSPFIETCSSLMVIDTVQSENITPGSIVRFTKDDIRSGNIQMRMSPHQVGLLDILALSELRGDSPENVEFFCVTPVSLKTGLELSPELKPLVEQIAGMVISRLDEMNIRNITKRT